MNDVGFEVQEHADGTVRVRTHGMGRRGRPEIEVENLAPAQVAAARDLLSRIAATVSKRPVFSGQLMYVADDLSVELRESEHMQVGFLARAFGASDRTVMRITDAGRNTADGVLCGVARVRARELAAEGDPTGAARILHDALDAARVDDDAITGERALASIALSHIETDRDRALELLDQGLRACVIAQKRELSATIEEIQAFDAAHIARELRQIAAINLGLIDPHSMIDNSVRIVPSPLWQRATDQSQRAELGMTMVPGPWLRLYWCGSTRAELESGAIPDIAADVFVRLAGRPDGIARMAFIVRETQKTFPLSDDAPRATAAPDDVAPHIYLASAVLAHVARLRTAELTPTQIEAAFGLNHDHECAAIARDKSRRLRVRLAQWTRDGYASA